jgi:hypothetical protein
LRLLEEEGFSDVRVFEGSFDVIVATR